MGKKINVPGHGPVKTYGDGLSGSIPGDGPVDIESPSAGPATGDGMLFEDGNFMLYENGDYMIYE